jgi:hypothetical protein
MKWRVHYQIYSHQDSPPRLVADQYVEVEGPEGVAGEPVAYAVARDWIDQHDALYDDRIDPGIRFVSATPVEGDT